MYICTNILLAKCFNYPVTQLLNEVVSSIILIYERTQITSLKIAFVSYFRVWRCGPGQCFGIPGQKFVVSTNIWYVRSGLPGILNAVRRLKSPICGRNSYLYVAFTFLTTFSETTTKFGSLRILLGVRKFMVQTNSTETYGNNFQYFTVWVCTPVFSYMYALNYVA